MYNGVTICCFFEVEVALNALSNPVISTLPAIFVIKILKKFEKNLKTLKTVVFCCNSVVEHLIYYSHSQGNKQNKNKNPSIKSKEKENRHDNDAQILNPLKKQHKQKFRKRRKKNEKD